MKSISTFFNEFLKDEVNLNQTRLKVAENGIEVIKNFLNRNQIFSNNVRSIKPQGSYRQGTIIKPFGESSDFDVDLLLFLHEFNNWQPKDYLNNLHNEFKNTKRYCELVDRRGKSRCVTIDYESDFHIDIVPAVKINGRFKIMNKNSNEFEDTDGDGYAEWFESKNSITSSQYLTKVVRLIKYLRDYKKTFSIKSVLLTSLLGKQIYQSDIYQKHILYKDLPTSFKTLFNRLDCYLQSRPSLTDEIITNPVLPTEKFRHFDQNKYLNFRNRINTYNNWINAAYEEQNINEAVKKWQKIFGDDFGEIQETISNLSTSSKNDSLIYQEDFVEDNYDFNLSKKYNFHITVYPKPYPKSSSHGFNQPIPIGYKKDEELTFSVQEYIQELPYGTVFKWKIKNSGSEAKANRDLRGKIEDDSGNGKKVEITKYKGKHDVNCYAIYDNTVIATDTIRVNIF
jgi:hypothetical protein